MARRSIRGRILTASIISALLAVLLFAAGSFAFMWIDNLDIQMDDGDTFRDEAIELVLTAMAFSAPMALAGATATAAILSQRISRPLEEAIRAARETTAHDLQRSLPVPERDDELRDLALELNGLFVRLDDGFGALARFAADASHELRTPLAVMATELEVALRHPRAPAEWEATGQLTLEELRRLAALVEGLLTLARAGADAPAARRRVRLVECVDAVVAQLAATAERAGVALAGPTDDPEVHVDGNPVMIETAIRNLVENAIRAVPRGGRVQASIEARAAELVVAIDDDGPGLGADVEALFVPFQRGTALPADSSGRSAGAGAGVGLGLAIARRIARAHDGELEGGRSALGGARLALTLPRSKQDP